MTTYSTWSRWLDPIYREQQDQREKKRIEILNNILSILQKKLKSSFDWVEMKEGFLLIEGEQVIVYLTYFGDKGHLKVQVNDYSLRTNKFGVLSD